MALEHDSRGFLVGDPIDLKRMPNDISHIRDDISAIRRAIAGRGSNFKRDEMFRAAVPERGANGRFVSSASPNVATPTGARKGDSNLVARFAGNAKAAIALPAARSAGVISSIAARIEPADPSVRAMREVAEPLQRGFELFRGDKQTSWLKKIFKSLNIFHKEDTVYNKAAKKSLKAIEEKTVMGGGAYRSGSLVDKIPGIATIARTGVTGGLLGLLTKAGRGAKGLFKRIPVIGSLLAGAGAAFDIFSSENDNTLSRQQKDKAAGKSIGGWTGSLGGIAAGAAAGSMLGPVGTVVGGVVGGFLGDQAGQVIGEKFGGWVNDLRQADIPGKLVSKFEEATGGFDFQKGFQLWLDRTKSNFTGAGNIVGEQLNDLNNYAKANTGIDFKDMGAKWWERTEANASRAWDTLNGVPSWMMDNTTLGKAGKRVTSTFKGSVPGMSEAQAAAFAADVRRTESSGNYGIENGRGSLGAYQFDAAALADTGLVSLAKLKAAKKSGQYNQKSFLADPANWTLAGGKDAFLSDSSLQDKTFQDMQALNFTRGVRSGAIGMAAKPEEVAAYLKAAHLGGATGASDYFLRGIDRSDGLTLISQYAKQGAVAVASAPKISRPPSPPSMPPITEAPKVVEPLSSPKPPQFTVNIPSQDVGQDVRDRRIAHIASGGISRL